MADEHEGLPVDERAHPGGWKTERASPTYHRGSDLEATRRARERAYSSDPGAVETLPAALPKVKNSSHSGSSRTSRTRFRGV